MKYAFFDVDNTLYNGYSATDFIQFLDQQEVLAQGLGERFQNMLEEYRARKVDYNTIAQMGLDLISKSVKGFSLDKTAKLVGQMLEQKEAMLNPWAMPVLEYLELHSYTPVLISAGPDFIISLIAKRLGIAEWFATSIESWQDAYIGAATHVMNDHKKTAKVAAILKREQPEFSIAFGDSPGDIPMLELVDQAFVVMNDHHQEMIDYAKSHKWNVFSTAEEVIEILKKHK